MMRRWTQLFVPTNQTWSLCHRLVLIPPQLVDLVDDYGREILEDSLGHMMLSEDEWGEMLEKGPRITPYMDVILKSNAEQYIEFVHRLFQGGMINFIDRPAGPGLPVFRAQEEQEAQVGPRLPECQ